MKVTFLHPDLGIGGAERLVVDAAIAMKKNGHDISACMIVFRLFRMLGIFKAKLFYYCHFPDLLLTDRETFAKKAYRYVIDAVEGWSTNMADIICVNSKFTEGIVRETFTRLTARLHVLYPTINEQFFDDCPLIPVEDIPETAKHIFVSINRFERKKNIGLAMEAFGSLREKLSPEAYKECFLVVAGGFDKNNVENLLYHHELREYAVDLKISTKQILFLRSPSDEVKVALLRRAKAVLYTPDREHFGIVPVEAMYMKCCVIAVNSGGPKESVVDGETGFLVEADPASFADKMAMLVKGDADAEKLGAAGRRRVLKVFSMENFASRLEAIMQSAFQE